MPVETTGYSPSQYYESRFWNPVATMASIRASAQFDDDELRRGAMRAIPQRHQGRLVGLIAVASLIVIAATSGVVCTSYGQQPLPPPTSLPQIGRASCREG